MTEPTITIVPDADQVALRTAELITQTAIQAIQERGRFTLVLSGGSTPEKAYAILAEPRFADRIDWPRWELFFGDERFVPHDDPRSNAAMADRTLLSHVPIPPRNVHPIPTHLGTAQECAEAWQAQLRTQFPSLPQFDLVLLGLGDDGHTASLFPGKPALWEQSAWAVGSTPGVLPPPVDRVTLTFPVLNAARHAVFLVTGEKKADVVHKLLRQNPPISEAPAIGVQPATGTLTWLLDTAAAAKL
ncbi:MAG: 6-phosphogluconolactonase [Bacteroidales bacterium]|nr:6-phosphogluconolactonase [Bacteroidales bacterium]